MDTLLNKLRMNCVLQAKRHTINYQYYKHTAKMFEIPTIILSVFSGSFTVGSDVFLDEAISTFFSYLRGSDP